MKYTLFVFAVLFLALAGCSSEPSNKAGAVDTTAATSNASTTPAQPAEVKPVSTSDDVTLMAEYLVFTHLADSLVYRPVNDTAAMAKLMQQIDMTKPNVNSTMMELSLTYLQGIFTKAVPPLQQFAGNVKSPEIQRMAEEFNSSLQQVSNQYTRALSLIKQGGNDSARAEQMQQVGQLLQGSGLSISRLKFEEGSQAAFTAAHRVLGR